MVLASSKNSFQLLIKLKSKMIKKITYKILIVFDDPAPCCHPLTQITICPDATNPYFLPKSTPKLVLFSTSLAKSSSWASINWRKNTWNTFTSFFTWNYYLCTKGVQLLCEVEVDGRPVRIQLQPQLGNWGGTWRTSWRCHRKQSRPQWPRPSR